MAEPYHDSPTDVLSDVREFGLGDAFWSRHTAIAAVCPDKSPESLLLHLANNCARHEPRPMPRSFTPRSNAKPTRRK